MANLCVLENCLEYDDIPVCFKDVIELIIFICFEFKRISQLVTLSRVCKYTNQLYKNIIPEEIIKIITLNTEYGLKWTNIHTNPIKDLSITNIQEIDGESSDFTVYDERNVIVFEVPDDKIKNLTIKEDLVIFSNTEFQEIFPKTKLSIICESMYLKINENFYSPLDTAEQYLANYLSTLCYKHNGFLNHESNIETINIIAKHNNILIRSAIQLNDLKKISFIFYTSKKLMDILNKDQYVGNLCTIL